MLEGNLALKFMKATLVLRRGDIAHNYSHLNERLVIRHVKARFYAILIIIVRHKHAHRPVPLIKNS